MPDADPPNPDSTVWADARNDRLCDRFESLLIAGQPVNAFDFLRGAGVDPAAAGPDLLRDLARLEAYYRPAEQTKEAEVPPPPADDDRPDVGPGTVVGGRYTMVEKIGSGGMGEVWMARQTASLKRTVAVKVIKRGMDSKAVLARFDAERQALAVMNHENIARILDGGVHDGRPFFVMELVKGVPITQFCDARKLTPEQRLELFVPVCRALQHAHQKGVIHRDIKPSNVLVALYDDRPVPKVIDFGIAKATGVSLTDMTLVTGFGAVVGTPEYMSPEQAGFNQLDIDTRTDVYSLGVLLYELLTGTTPVDRKSLAQGALHEILRIVREVDAPRPSDKLSSSDALPTLAANRGTEPKRLTGLFRGELDWIVLKALEKDRGRRYESALAFAADVERHLANEVVDARPPTPGYRLRKFVRRNKGPALAVAAVFVALLGGVVGTTLGLLEANHQRDEKEDARGKEATQRVRADGEAAAALRSRDDARSQFYAAKMNLADAAWRDGDAITANAHLDALVPKPGETDLRGWEWYEMARSRDVAESLPPPARNRHDVLHAEVAVTPDGARFVVTSHYDPARKSLEVRSVADREVVGRVTGIPHPPFRAAYGPDGSLALLSETGVSFHAPDGTPRWTVELADKLTYQVVFEQITHALAVDRKGDWVAVGGRAKSLSDQGRIVVLGAANGRIHHDIQVPPVSPGRKGWVTAMLPLAEGGLVCGCEDGQGRLWPADFSQPAILDTRWRSGVNGVAAIGSSGGKPYENVSFAGLRLPSIMFELHPRPERRFELSHPDPTLHALTPHVATLRQSAYASQFTGQFASGPDGWIAPGGREGIVGVSETPCGRLLFLVGASRAVFLRPPQGGLTRMVALRSGSSGLTADPSGTALAVVGSTNRIDAELCVYDTDTGLQHGKVRLPRKWTAIEVAKYSRTGVLATSGDGRVLVFDGRTGSERFSVPLTDEGMRAWGFSPDGRLVVLTANGTTIRDAETGVEQGHLRLPNWPNQAGQQSQRQLVAGEGWIAHGDPFRPGIVVQAMNGDPAHGGEGGRRISDEVGRLLVTDPTGRWLAVVSNRTVRVWDSRSWAAPTVLGPHREEVRGVAFHPTERRVAVVAHTRVTLWDSESGRSLRDIHHEPAQQMTEAVFSPSGRHLYGFQGGLRRLWVWDADATRPDPIETEARGLIDVVRAATDQMTDPPADVRDRLDKFPNVSVPVRRKALEIFDAYDARRKAFKGVPNPSTK